MEENGLGDELEEYQPLILFDGVCNFCNGFVNFLIRRDSEKKFHFAALQSEKGKEIREKLGVEQDNLESVILLEESRVYIRSEAVVRIMKNLDGLWRTLGFLYQLVPRPLRDLDYRIFARYRYFLFGKKDSCMVPDEELKDRFIG